MLIAGAGANDPPAWGGALTFHMDNSPSNAWWALGSANILKPIFKYSIKEGFIMASIFGKISQIIEDNKDAYKDPNKVLHTGDLVFAKNVALYSDPTTKLHDVIHQKKYYVYNADKITNNRVPVSENFIDCGKLPTSLNIKGWIDRNDIQFLKTDK